MISDFLWRTRHLKMNHGTDAVAVAAVASPIWLEHVSQGAALVLPILGCLWLAVQIVGYLVKKGK